MENLENGVLLCIEICEELRYDFSVGSAWQSKCIWGKKMVIRDYEPRDCGELAELFYNTVHTVNAKDYTKEQLDVWATGKVDLEKWDQLLQGFRKNYYTRLYYSKALF